MPETGDCAMACPGGAEPQVVLQRQVGRKTSYWPTDGVHTWCTKTTRTWKESGTKCPGKPMSWSDPFPAPDHPTVTEQCERPAPKVEQRQCASNPDRVQSRTQEWYWHGAEGQWKLEPEWSAWTPECPPGDCPDGGKPKTQTEKRTKLRQWTSDHGSGDGGGSQCNLEKTPQKRTRKVCPGSAPAAWSEWTADGRPHASSCPTRLPVEYEYRYCPDSPTIQQTRSRRKRRMGDGPGSYRYVETQWSLWTPPCPDSAQACTRTTIIETGPDIDREEACKVKGEGRTCKGQRIVTRTAEREVTRCADGVSQDSVERGVWRWKKDSTRYGQCKLNTGEVCRRREEDQGNGNGDHDGGGQDTGNTGNTGNTGGGGVAAVSTGGYNDDGIGVDGTVSSASDGSTPADRGEPDPNANDDSTGDGDGNSGAGCFLTTAVVEQRGEADDGPTLTTLRNFRDTFMRQSAQHRALVAQYYNVAPAIVDRIPLAHPDWTWIAQQVDASVEAIHAEQPDRAIRLYKTMVETLQRKWPDRRTDGKET